MLKPYAYLYLLHHNLNYHTNIEKTIAIEKKK